MALPDAVPGYHEYEAKEDQLKVIADRLFPPTPGTEPRRVGRGVTWLARPSDLAHIVAAEGLIPNVSGAGVDFIQRRGADFELFYLYNPGHEPMTDRITFRAHRQGRTMGCQDGPD